MDNLIGNFACYCYKEITYGDINSCCCNEAIWWCFGLALCFSQAIYASVIFTTQTISYTYDKLNQLTSVSNYGNLELKMV